MGKEPKIVKAPVLLFDLIINSLDFMAKLLPKQFEDPAELAKIGKYYAVEDMLTTDPSEKVSRRVFFVFVCFVYFVFCTAYSRVARGCR